MDIHTIARIAHEANRAYCDATGDYSQVAWEDAPDWQRSSAVDGVCFVRDNPGKPPSASHDNWMAYKEANGWVYGPVKNEETKEHPCMVPYYQLPPHQRIKDALFKAVAEALLP